MGRKSWLAVAAVLGVTYLTSPYVALFRLSQDLQSGDLDAVRSDVDWQRVRAGLRQDVAEQFAGVKLAAVAQRDACRPSAPPSCRASPTHMVDDAVTPEALCAAMHGAGAVRVASLRGWGMFEGPVSFAATLRPAGTPPMTLHLRLEGTEWKVTGVHFQGGTGQSRT